MNAPDSNGNVVRINLGRVGALIGLALFVIQIVTMAVVMARSAASIEARVDVLTSTVGRLVEANLDLLGAINTLKQDQALNRQRIDVLEKANPPGRRIP